MRYRAGDLIGVENLSLMGQLAYRAFTPQTHLFHFLVVRSYLELEDDYEIIEMLGKGCSIGRLSWYDDKNYCVFRLTDPEALELGKQAAKYASKFGRRKYDYDLFIKLPIDCIKCWFHQLVKEHKLRRIRPDELKLVWDKAFVCTELPKAIWEEVGKEIIRGAGIPAAYIGALQDKTLTLIDMVSKGVSVK